MLGAARHSRRAAVQFRWGRVDAYETLLGEDDLELQRARGVLGTMLCTNREFDRARAVQEEVVAAFLRESVEYSVRHR